MSLSPTAQAAATRSESLFQDRSLLDAALDCIISIDRDSRILEFNAAAERTFGYPRSLVLGQKMPDLIIPPQHRPRHYAGMKRFLETGVGPVLRKRIEITARRADGTEFPVELAITPIERDGQLFFTAFLRDISERKRVENALRESEARYRDLLENAGDLIQSVDADGRFEYVNQTWKNVMGYGDADLSELALLDVIHPDERAQAREWFGRARAGETLLDLQTAFLAKDGRKVLVEGTWSPRRVEGKWSSVRAMLRDVTARRRAEAEASFQNALVKAQYEASPDAILVVGSDDRVWSYNQRFVEMWGIPPEAMATGRAEVMRQAVRNNLADPENWFARTAEIYRDRTASTQDEIEFRDGRVLERYSTPITAPDGSYQGRVWYFSDVTRRRRAEQALQRQNAYLSALQDTSVGLIGRLDVNALLEDIVARAGALVGTDNGYVFLKDANESEMELRVGVGAYEGFVGRRAQPGVGLAGQVWATAAPVVVDDYRTWSGRLTDPSRDILRAVAGVPLSSGSEVLGVIGLAYLDEERKFGEAEIQVLQRFAQLATIALDNARLYETARKELAERTRAEQALAQQLRETELIRRATSHAIELNVESALEHICRDLADYFQVEQAGIALLNDDRQTLTIVADHSPAGKPSVVGLTIPVTGNPSTEIVLQTRRPAAFADAQTDPRLASIRELMQTRGTASILIAPLFVRDEIIGTVGIDSYQRREFTEGDIAVVQRVALSIANALENARLYRAAQLELAERTRAEQETRRRNQELEVVNRVSAVMTTEIDWITALETLARELVRIFNARNCGIALLNSERTELTVVADALTKDHEEYSVGIVIPVSGNPSSEYVVSTGKSLVIPEPQTDPRTALIRDRMIQRGTHCLAIVPLVAGGQVIGTLGLDTTDPDYVYGEQEIRLAETLASQMAIAIEKQRLFDQTRQRAQELTVLNEMARALSGTLDEAELFATTYRYLKQLMPTDAFMAWLYDDETRQVTRPALWDLDQFYSDDEPPRAPSGSVARVIETGEPVFINWTREEIAEQKRRLQDIVGSSDPSASLMFVPLRLGQRVRGVISVQSYQQNAYGEPQVALLISASNYLVTALENAHLFEQTDRALAETQNLYEISARLNAAANLQQALEAASGPAIVQGAKTTALLRALGASAGAPEAFELVAAWPRHSQALGTAGSRFSSEQLASASEWLSNPREPVLIDALTGDPRVNPQARELLQAQGVKSIAILPLRIGERWIGALAFHWAEPRAFTAEDTRLYRAIMAQAATVLDNRQLFEQTQVALAQTRAALGQVEQAQQRLNLQYQTANLLAEARSFDEVATHLLGLTCIAFGWQVGEYWKLDETSQQLVFGHVWHVDDARVANFAENARALAFTRGEGLVGQAWERAQPVWLSDMNDPNALIKLSAAPEAGLASAVAFPLTSESRMFGVTTFFSTRPQEMDDAVMATMVGVGSQITQFMERRLAEEAVRQQNTYLMALHDTTLGLMRRLELEELLQNLIVRAAELVGTAHGYVHLVEPGGAELRMRVGIGVYQDFVGTRVKPGQGLAGTVWRDRAPIVVDDYRYWEGRLPMVDRDVLRAVVGVPLVSGGQTVGVLGLASLEEGRRFTAAQVEALDRFAELATVALDNAQLYDALQQALTQSQRLARREKASAEIADKLYAAPDVKSVLQTAAKELRRTTGSRRAVVRLRLDGQGGTRGDQPLELAVRDDGGA